MERLGAWLQPVSRWLVAWLVSTWGTLLLLTGTFTLAASASAYLTSVYGHPAQVGGSVPAADTPVPAPSLCTTLVDGGALTLPAQCTADVHATVASWEGKYFYWTARPNQFDSTITSVVPTYPMPDYPSAHAATYGGTSTVLAYLFPRDATFFKSRAEELAVSRIWAGIHSRSAVEAGLVLGRSTGKLVIARAKEDGAR